MTTWLQAGNVVPVFGLIPHWFWFAFGLLLVIEDALPRLEKIKGNSLIQCFVNMLVLVMTMLSKIPLIQVVAKAASPEVLTEVQTLAAASVVAPVVVAPAPIPAIPTMPEQPPSAPVKIEQPAPAAAPAVVPAAVPATPTPVEGAK